MIEAFTRRHTPKKTQRNLTYDEQLGAKVKVHGQTPLFAEDEDEAEEVAPKSDEDDDMVEVAGETLQNPFDDEAVARNLQQEEFEAPPSSDPPDISIQLAVEQSQREAARRRDEEDLALIRALQASKSDARLQFVAGAKEPSIAATNTTASLAGDSEEDDFEEVEVPDPSIMERSNSEAPFLQNQHQRLDQPLEVSPMGLRAETPLDSEDEALIGAAIDQDQENQARKAVALAPGPEERVLAKPSISPPAAKEVQETHISTVDAPSGISVEQRRYTALDTANPKHQEERATYSGPSVTTANTEKLQSAAKVSRPKDVFPPQRKQLSVHMPITNIQPPRRNDLYPPSAPTPTVTMTGKATVIPDHPHLFSPHQNEIATNGLLDDPISEEVDLAPAESVGSREKVDGKPESPEPRDTHRIEAEVDDFDEDDLDDSRSLEWSVSPEPERRQTQTDTFPAPPPDLEEDEGGIDMNAEGDDYARFLAEIKGRNLEQVRQEIDNEIRNLNQQNKVAMRDSEDITHQMVAQIQVCPPDVIRIMHDVVILYSLSFYFGSSESHTSLRPWKPRRNALNWPN